MIAVPKKNTLHSKIDEPPESSPTLSTFVNYPAQTLAGVFK